MIYVPSGTEQDQELYYHTKECLQLQGLRIAYFFDTQIFWPAVKPQIKGEYCLSVWVRFLAKPMACFHKRL